MASTNPSGTNINVPIHIERIDEYQIQEITYDGQEKHIPPLSMSENLSRLIAKIDFNQPIEELRQELESTDVKSPDSNSQAPSSSLPVHPIWPFDSIRTKLRLALTEISVLSDVLSIVKDKKYMVFDTVQAQLGDQRQIVGVMAKKRALATASQTLIDAATAIRGMNATRSLGAENSSATSAESISYEELREMRKVWRLKRLGNSIYGDLSYFRPIGQRFTPSYRFEVVKTNPATSPTGQALSVRLPPDLEGRASIQVSIIKNEKFLVDLATSSSGRCYEPVAERTWQEKLETAQNVLICKELFAHLAKEAIQYQFVIPTTVTGNQIILALFTDVKLYITLVHHTPNTKCSREMSEGMKRLQKEHQPVLEHTLHKMLRDFYQVFFRRMQGREQPREAGPTAMDRQSLFELSRQESSLDKVVQQAQHIIMRQQTMEVIDTFARKIKDPMLISHWFCLNSPTQSMVRLDIISQTNEILGRSHMLIYIGTRQLRVITRDCKNLVLGYEPDELRHLLLWQACLHQFIASDKLSKLLGWYTLILNYNVNVTRRDVSSTAFSLVICSPNCSYLILIKSGPQYGLTIEVGQFKDAHHQSNGLSGLMNHHHHLLAQHSMDWTPSQHDPLDSLHGSGAEDSSRLSKLHELIDHFREVDWDRMPGKHFLGKLELLMASLSD